MIPVYTYLELFKINRGRIIIYLEFLTIEQNKTPYLVVQIITGVLQSYLKYNIFPLKISHGLMVRDRDIRVGGREVQRRAAGG